MASENYRSCTNVFFAFAFLFYLCWCIICRWTRLLCRIVLPEFCKRWVLCRKLAVFEKAFQKGVSPQPAHFQTESRSFWPPKPATTLIRSSPTRVGSNFNQSELTFAATKA